MLNTITEPRGSRALPELRSRTHQALDQKVQQRPELQNLDRTRLSDELLNDVQRAAQAQDPGANLDSLLDAVTQNFADRKAEEAGPAEEQPKKKVDVEWLPEVNPGEIMQPQGYTGQLVYKESKEQPKTEGINKAAKSGKRPPSPSATASKPNSPVGGTSKNQSNSTVNTTGDNKSDTVELTAESAQMAQKMQQSGMQSKGLEKAAEQKGGKPEERVDVHMPALGMTQLVDVTPAGQLGSNKVLGTYRKLDDMPAWNGAILRKRTGKEFADDYKRRVESGEQVPKLTEEQLEKLRNPVATDK